MQILPSELGPADHDRDGLQLAPFRGVRYVPDRVSGLADVTSPPYDVIISDKEDQLMAADPHNVVRLILPRSAGHPGDQYHEAALSLARWQADGILTADREPALYLYEQAVTVTGDDVAEGGLIQRGLIGALRLVPLDAGIVLPHEDVAPGPVAGRLALMEATEANLEPIFLLYDGSRPGATAQVVAGAAGRRPLLEARPGDGLRHRLWAITDPDALAAVAADLGPRQALIADGHHRYAAYRELQGRRRRAGAGPGPWDFGLALLVDSAAYPPHIGAIHRVIPGLSVGDAVKLAGPAFRVQALPGGTSDLPAALDVLAGAAAAGPAFVVAGSDRAYLLSEPDPAQAAAAMPGGRSAQWQALSASVLQELLITALWAVTDDEQNVRVVHHDAAAAVRAADSAAGTAVLCTPMSPADVYAVAERGEKVPRKSTSFAPKPRTGFVLRTFAQG